MSDKVITAIGCLGHMRRHKENIHSGQGPGQPSFIKDVLKGNAWPRNNCLKCLKRVSFVHYRHILGQRAQLQTDHLCHNGDPAFTQLASGWVLPLVSY